LTAVSQCALAIRHVPDKHKTPEIYLVAVEQDFQLISEIPQTFWAALAQG